MHFQLLWETALAMISAGIAIVLNLVESMKVPGGQATTKGSEA